MNESTDMVIENLEDIDTVVIDIHRFIPFEGHFMEVMTDQHTTLFIDWKVKPKDIGKKGAMGTVTHAVFKQLMSIHASNVLTVNRI